MPQRERRSFGDIDLELTWIKFQHGGVGDPGIGLQLVAHHGGIKKQQRRTAGDAADRQDFVLAQLPAAVDGNPRNAETGGIGEPIAGVGQGRSQLFDVAAPDDAEAGTAKQQQGRRGDAGAVRKVTVDQGEQAVRLRLAFPARFGAGARQAEMLAQQHDRADGGSFQISLGPQRSQRSGEASCTIHCSSSSSVVPAKACEF